jgi:hypothetical protein
LNNEINSPAFGGAICVYWAYPNISIQPTNILGLFLFTAPKTYPSN